MKNTDLQSMVRTLQKLEDRTENLWFRSMRNGALIGALHGAITRLVETQRGMSKEQFKEDFKERQKIGWQVLLEELESLDPALAAKLDRREMKDVL